MRSYSTLTPAQAAQYIASGTGSDLDVLFSKIGAGGGVRYYFSMDPTMEGLGIPNSSPLTK